MKDYSQQDSRIINFLRFPLTFLVVMQHCKGDIVIKQPFDDLTLIDVYYAIKIFFSGGLSFIAVPAFFLISGYLFFRHLDHFDSSIYKSKLQKRLLTLFIPYILWNLLCIPLVCFVKYFENYSNYPLGEVQEYLASIQWSQIFWNHNMTVVGCPNLFGMQTLNITPLLGTMWFVRDLIVMSILSPIVYIFIKKTRIYGIALITILYLLRIWPPISLNIISVYFFILGSYCSIERKTLHFPKTIATVSSIITLLILVFFVIAGGNENYWGWQLTPLFTLAGVCSILYLTDIYITHNPQIKTPVFLSDSSFFVYALHIEFTLPLGFFILKTATFNSSAPEILIIRYLLTPIVIYTLSIGIYILLKKSMPKVLSLLTGQRSSS